MEVSSVGSREASSDHTDFGDEWDDKELTLLMMTSVKANANIPNWTNYFTDITTTCYTQDSGPSLPENFDVSVATALDYFNLLFKQKYLVT